MSPSQDRMSRYGSRMISGEEAKRLRLQPVLWNEKGKVLEWSLIKGALVQPGRDGKIPFSWSYESGGKVSLWAYTKPPPGLEFIPWDSMNERQRSAFDACYQTAERVIAEMRFKLGPSAKRPREWREILEWVDDLDSMTANLEDRPDRWGRPSQRAIYLEAGDMVWKEKTKAQKAKARRGLAGYRKGLIELLGQWFLEIIEERDAKTLSDFAELLIETNHMSFAFGSSDTERVWYDAETFVGTVFRCYQVLRMWKRYDGLPTKRGLREYVLQEWLHMGMKELTVVTEFSEALKRLSLAGLPRASSRPLSVRRSSKGRKSKKDES